MEPLPSPVIITAIHLHHYLQAVIKVWIGLKSILLTQLSVEERRSTFLVEGLNTLKSIVLDVSSFTPFHASKTRELMRNLSVHFTSEVIQTLEPMGFLLCFAGNRFHMLTTQGDSTVRPVNRSLGIA